MTSVVIPADSGRIGTRYFNPRYATIAIGESIKWINADSRSHSLVFDLEIPPYGTKIGEVKPLDTFEKFFDVYVPRLEYSCAIHPQEKGSIIIYPKKADEMSNTDKLRHLVGAFDIKLPDTGILNHLAHAKTPTGHALSPVLVEHNITLESFLDTRIYKILSDPELYQLQSKNLTIVFWDISSFSDLCNILMNEPISVAGFLRDYFESAIRIINGYGGIVDKFIGDGILAYFGLDGSHSFDSAENAIKAALDLKQAFKGVSETWLKIWSKDFYHENISIGLKCGIHDGEVLFGLLNTDTRSQITILGPNVNLTSRLEGKAENDQIIISEEVKDLVKDKFEITSFKLMEPIQSYPEIKRLYSVTGKIQTDT
jgi:class 3 adenylate cyclase